MPSITRRSFLQTIAVGAPALCLGDLALGAGTKAAPSAATAAYDQQHTPLNTTWPRLADPEQAGFSPDALEALEQTLYPLSTTSFMIVRGGKIVYTYGDISQVSYLASARKSVLSLLYGKYVENGTIDLNRTIGELGIDDDGGLLPIEKTARIRDLLIASSGVYHPAGSPGSSDVTPARGSKQPGTYFFYNNWDFNVAGVIFEKLTGKSVFQALQEDLAKPLGFEDFDPLRQRMMGYMPRRSQHLAYHLFLSGRDMARLGLLTLNGGKWNGIQVVPARWIQESTRLHVKAADMAARSPSGYGYLWWIPSESRHDPEWAGSFLANGNFGQFILGLPALDIVVVHRRAVTDEFAIARNWGRSKASPAGGEVNFLAIADKVVAAARKT